MEGTSLSCILFIFMHIYISLHVLRDLLQVVDEVLLVFVDLASFFGDDAGIDVERLIERDGDEVLVGQDGLAREEGRADAALDEILDGVQVRREVDDARFAAMRGVEVVDHAIDEEVAVEHDELLVGKVGERDRFALGQRMEGIGDEAALAVIEFLVAELLAEAGRVVRQGDVELLVLDHLQGADAARLDDLELDLRMGKPELSENARQEARADLQRQGHADVIAVVRHVLDFRLELIHLGQNVVDFAKQFAVLRRHDEFPALAVKQVQSGLRLECLHRDADCRL